MRRAEFVRRWTFLAGVLLFAAAALAWGTSRSGAAAPALWTEGEGPGPAVTAPWVAVARADTPAVVNISTTQVVRNPSASDENEEPSPGDPFPDFFRHFFGDMPPSFRTHSLGSGFVIRQDGYVATNNHVVDGATEIMVRLSDGRRFAARVIGRDRKTDLALLKIGATNLPVLALGDSDALQVGEPVMAIGNPFGLEGTVTIGIVSAKERVIGQGPYDDFIQTDASINPGNSGGPLVNSAGQVVGVNTAILSRTGGSVGIGFAIPINQVKAILPELEAKGRVTRGWLGVLVQPVTPDLAKAFRLPEARGALVAQVLRDSPAARAGLQAGDVIVGFDGRALEKDGELPRFVAATPVGREVPLQVIRDRRSLTLTVRVAELPEPQEVAAADPDRVRLGVAVQILTPELAQQLGVPDRGGVVVVAVKDGSPAAEAGIEPGDIIAEANRQPVQTVADLRRALEAQDAGEPLLLQLHRKGSSLFVALRTES